MLYSTSWNCVAHDCRLGMSKTNKLTILAVLVLATRLAGEPSKIADIEYAKPDGYSLKLDLYLPESGPDDRSPVVVFVNGGGWKNGSKKTAARTAAWLANHGIAVASINYRLTDVAGWPAQINDCYESVRWLRRNAAKYQLDADHIGCWGTSAGGHLAILMGTRPYPKEESTSSRVIAVCDWFGPSDLLTMPPNNVGNGRTERDVAMSNGAKLLRATVRKVPALAKDASGLYHVSKGDSAFLIMHGEKDPGVPLEQSQRLHLALKKAGVDSKLEVIPDAKHGGPHFRTKEAKASVLEFFQRTLGQKKDR